MSFALDDPIDKIFSCVECGHPPQIYTSGTTNVG